MELQTITLKLDAEKFTKELQTVSDRIAKVGEQLGELELRSRQYSSDITSLQPAIEKIVRAVLEAEVGILKEEIIYGKDRR